MSVVQAATSTREKSTITLQSRRVRTISMTSCSSSCSLLNVNYYFPSATIISSVRGTPYRGSNFGLFVSLSLLFLASSAR